ncbi:nuclear pore complex protein NUP1 [Ziziphus jujuba]|uniref:Nuclear pore complex protein NUP1 n=1 Tax=Ziziphus jujuba TaxID=326968 RepID=A0A6P3YUS5_ZIZJJ|nr:nuclear pore complex protein NUP1 [Ziziphus jujuba]
MGADADADTTPSLDGGREGRGAGGKLRKPSARKPPTTPYARPANSLVERGQPRRWLSKLVDPACRLIVTGANRFLPSFFSKSTYSTALPETNVEDHDKWDTEVEPNACGGDHDCSLNHELPTTTELAGPSRADKSESASDLDLHKQEKDGDLPNDNGLFEIEQLLKEKHFSRGEVSRLMEIINSKAVELPTLEHEQKNQSMAAGGEAEGPVVSHEIQKMSFEKNKEDKSGAWDFSTPLCQSVMADKVGASPIEIARAYMGSRTSELDISSKRIISNDERNLLLDSEIAIEPFVPSPLSKPSACWPGAVLQDQRGYSTPLSQRGRFGLHNFPRTPYSRSIFSKSKSKLSQLQGDKDKLLIPSSSLQQCQTPTFGQVNLRSDALDDHYGSVGPIRRPRHKFVAQTPARGSIFVNSSVGPSKVENTNPSRAFLPAVRKNFEHGEASSSSQFQSVERKQRSFEGVPTVHPQSTQIARKILEHIDRKTPTPKDKSEELKLVTSWKKTPSSDSTSIISNGYDSLLPVKGFYSDKIMDPDNPKTSAKESADKSNSLMKSTLEATDTVISRVPGSDAYIGNGGDGGSVSKSLLEGVPKITSSQLPDLQKKPPLSSWAKPALSNIAIDKPESKWRFSSDNSSGFSFPVSTSPEVLSEPPTPSIMPTFSGSSQHHPNDAVPKYTFGEAKSGPDLVFSFPSTTNTAIHNDASDIKFSFGSNKTRISFGSIGKNTICY